jgi:hypothetical protein
MTDSYTVIVIEDSDAAPTVPRRPRRPNRRKVPPTVIEATPKPNRRELKAEIAAIGGWDSEVACGATARQPRRTFKSAKREASDIYEQNRLGDETRDPAVLNDDFCRPLDIKGKRCPDTNKKGGILKAIRIAVGSKDRRYSDLAKRPQYRQLAEAMQDHYGVTLKPTGAHTAAMVREEATERCIPQHENRKDEIVSEAKTPRKRKPRSVVPF